MALPLNIKRASGRLYVGTGGGKTWTIWYGVTTKQWYAMTEDGQVKSAHSLRALAWIIEN
jgi:hypothetical protein